MQTVGGMSQPAAAGALSISATGKTPKQVKEAVEKAGERWLKNPEVIDILQNYEKYEFKVSNEPPVQPPGQSVVNFFCQQPLWMLVVAHQFLALDFIIHHPHSPLSSRWIYLSFRQKASSVFPEGRSQLAQET